VAAEHVAVLSADPGLAGEVRRLAALVGRTVLVADRLVDCPRVCRNAALVVVDARAADLDVESMPMREVVVVADDPLRIATWEMAVRMGARRVLTLPGQAPELLDLLALAGERPGPPGPLIAVMGGTGGAGASVLSVALGWAFTQLGRPTTVVDLDVHGGGLVVLVGLERVDGLRWNDLSDARGVVAAATLREQLPTVDALAILSTTVGPAATDGSVLTLPDRAAVASVLAAMRRGGDVVVADVPRQCGDDVGAVVASCDALLLVVPAHVRGVSAAASVTHRMRPLCDDIHLVVRADGRSRLHERDVTDALGIQHLATVGADSGITAAIDRGQLLHSLRRSGLGRTARVIADRLLVGGLAQAS
jgi:secretion/DNA translocation related CpaE-like protein